MVAYSVCLLKRLARKYKVDVTSADKDLRGLVFTNFSYRSRIDDVKGDVERGSLSREGSCYDVTSAFFYLISSMRMSCIARHQPHF